MVFYSFARLLCLGVSSLSNLIDQVAELLGHSYLKELQKRAILEFL